MVLSKGTRLGSFEIGEPLGAGGMGEVYRAHDLRLGRDVALKVLAPELLVDKERLKRFLQEARAASALNHRSIVTVFEIGQALGQPYLAMELVEGRTLRAVIDDAPPPLKKALDLAAQIAEGLSAAHAAGIVHRDLKPENVMVLRDGGAKILDFGLAKPFGPGAGDRLGGEQAKTVSGFVLGTPGYMSPEQASGRVVDFRSDQFSLGLILYELTTGRRAFQRATAVQTLSAIIQEEPEPAARLNPRLPAPVLWIIDRCLAKDPEDRYAATRDLARELAQVRDNLARLTEGVPAAPAASHDRTGAATVVTPATLLQPAPVPAPTAATTAAPVAAPAPARAGRRALRVVGAALGVLALLAAGGGLGYLFRGLTVDEGADWRGELVLGGTTPVLGARPAPDGQTLAFVTTVNGVSQVAVMKPASGDWTVLTRRAGAGSVYRAAWSADGARIFFDRVTDVPHGIFSVPAVGGEERLVVEEAQGPEVLPDGSLLLLKTAPEGRFQLHRFWPETARLAPVGPPLLAESLGLAVRAFADGKEALVWGRLANGGGPGERARHLHLIDLATGATRPFAPDLPLAPPFSVAPDGRSVLATLTLSDLSRLVQVSRDGLSVRPLLTFTVRPSYLAAGPDGVLLVGLAERSADLLRFPATGGLPERLTPVAGRGTLSSPVSLGGGRFLVPGLLAGRRRILLRGPSGEPKPLLDTTEETSLPAVRLDASRVVLLAGPRGSAPELVVASLGEGRIVKRLPGTSGAAPQELSASPDGTTVYYPDRGSIWAAPTDGTAPPRKVGAGHGAAPLPDGKTLLVQRNGAGGVTLHLVSLGSDGERPVPLQGDLRLAPAPLSGRAVAADGRVAVTVAARDSWTWGPALLDAATGHVERIAVPFEGDVLSTGWDEEGRLIAMGTVQRSELWRFVPTATSAPGPRPGR